MCSPRSEVHPKLQRVGGCHWDGKRRARAWHMLYDGLTQHRISEHRIAEQSRAEQSRANQGIIKSGAHLLAACPGTAPAQSPAARQGCRGGGQPQRHGLAKSDASFRTQLAVLK